MCILFVFWFGVLVVFVYVGLLVCDFMNFGMLEFCLVLLGMVVGGWLVFVILVGFVGMICKVMIF